MNDRFKFRVWDKQQKKYEDLPKLINQKGELVSFTVRDDLSKFYDVEQCTGLKDKNGKLIYEGDIVKAFGFIDYYKLVCRFRDSSFCLDHIDGSPYNFAHSVAPVEVIGNIHENADLLKGEN